MPELTRTCRGQERVTPGDEVTGRDPRRLLNTGYILFADLGTIAVHMWHAYFSVYLSYVN